ncbi:MAG: hypothetical protein LBK74_05505 [Treponema sp.]|nr:hypothetical protein [Treponema sp.]
MSSSLFRPRILLAKNEAKEAGKHTLRTFNNEFILYSTLVSDQDKVDLGNHPHNPPSPIPDPLTWPEFIIKLLGIRLPAIIP